jgi:hypothetical protein
LAAGKNLPKYSINETITVTYSRANSEAKSASIPALALESLLKLRHEFTMAFSAGLTVLRFENLSSDSACYQLARWDADSEIVGK